MSMNNNKPKPKSNATALKHVASLLPVVALGTNMIFQDRRQLEIGIGYAPDQGAGGFIRIAKSRLPGKFIVQIGDSQAMTPIADPVQFLRLFLRNQRPATIVITRVGLRHSYDPPIWNAVRANAARGLQYVDLAVYEVPGDRRKVFENQRRNTAGRVIANRVTSAALNPATVLGKRRLMREFNDLMTR